MSSIQLNIYSLLVMIFLCDGYPENENRINFKTDNGKRVVLDELSISISTESYIACASLCLLDEDCCLTSYDKTYKQCRLITECNPDTEKWQNGIVTRKNGYVGCYRDCNGGRILGDKEKMWNYDLSVEKCNSLCQGYRYHGVQNNHECFCGHNMKSLLNPRAPENECNLPCWGDYTQICGGGCRISVYYVHV
ncbi:sialate:O-sulfotransferase 2-like [Mytilus trossulus]|uniref:sialate:O-sulfotransferase 2-like n=1 Tax=Mytilus trossulus TaxID=6551 RepID=UPI003006CC02